MAGGKNEFEEVKARVMAEKKISEKEFEELVERKKEGFGGLLTDETAARAVARDLGVREPDEVNDARVSELKTGMKKVHSRGVVLRVFPPRAFEKGGKKGKVCRVLIGDGEATALLVLWHGDVERVERGEIKKGAELEITNGYVKENGELHLSFDGAVSVLTPASQKTTPLGKLKDGLSADASGSILEIFPRREFEREGRKSSIASCRIKDETGEARVVLWDQHSLLLGAARVGDTLRVENGMVKNGELHVGARGNAFVLPAAPKKSSIRALAEGARCEIDAVVKKIEAKSFERDGRSRYLLIAMVDDGSAPITAVFFEEVANELLKIKRIPNDIDVQTIIDLKKKEIVGKQFRLQGRARPNKFLNELEFVVEKMP
ncbi:MAG: hypothetical protein AB1468_00950 [Candidatus Micrarchaeota archaeon]